MCSMQRETIYIDAFWTSSDILFGISSGNGQGCDKAWRGNAKCRHWPLALEYSARENREVSKGINNVAQIFSVSYTMFKQNNFVLNICM